jgi:hypothetical protein
MWEQVLGTCWKETDGPRANFCPKKILSPKTLKINLGLILLNVVVVCCEE